MEEKDEKRQSIIIETVLLFKLATVYEEVNQRNQFL